MPEKVLLQKDDLANNPDNYIRQERVLSTTGKTRLLVFDYGAFYEKDFSITRVDTNEVLSSDAYVFTDLYLEASLSSGQSVWNAVVLKDDLPTQEFKVDYRAYGGPYSRNVKKFIEWLALKEQDYLHPADWSEVTDIPKRLLPDFHQHLLKDIYGFEYIGEGIKRLENAIVEGNSLVLNLINEEIFDRLNKLSQESKEIAQRIIDRDIEPILNKVDKVYLGLDLIVNLSTATYDDIVKAADPAALSVYLEQDAYVTNKNMLEFSKIVKENFASAELTNLDKEQAVIAPSRRSTLIASVNGAVITLDSKANLKENAISYDDHVYPKDYPLEDRFIITRVGNHQDSKAGVFLGFNESKLDAYVGIFHGDECFRKIKWYRFYTDGNIDGLKQAIDDHVNDTKDPHELTKDQIGLGLVENYPVVTEEQILAQEPVKAYMTVDTMQYFMAANMLNLKAIRDKEGNIKLPDELFDKANIIFMPCDKKPEQVCPSKGQLIKTFCDGTEKIARYTDGACGFYDEVMEKNADDCKFFDKPKQGEKITEKCEGQKKVAVIADGRGSTFDVVIEEKSEDCGYTKPKPNGTALYTKCLNGNEITVYSDGNGGQFEILTGVNSRNCGFPGASEGQVIAEFCIGSNKVRRYSDGKGGAIEVIYIANSPDCSGAGGSLPPPTNPPNDPPSNNHKTLNAQSNKQLIKVGMTEQIRGNLNGFNPNSNVRVTIYHANQAVHGGREIELGSTEVFINSSGYGSFTFNHTVNNQMFEMVGTHLDRLDLRTWVVAEGIRSNEFMRVLTKNNTGNQNPGGGSHDNGSTVGGKISGILQEIGKYAYNYTVNVSNLSPHSSVRIHKEDRYGTVEEAFTPTAGADGTASIRGGWAPGVPGKSIVFRLADKPSEFVTFTSIPRRVIGLDPNDSP